VLSMIAKNCSGVVPTPGPLADSDEALLDSARALLDRTRSCMAEIASHRALELIWEVCGAANRYVDAQAPWTLRKSDPARMATVLWVLAETVRRLAILTQPYMPEASGKMLDLLAISPTDRSFASLERALPAGSRLPSPVGVFPRHVEPEAA
jgi:methionyl-tRNA synthetase